MSNQGWKSIAEKRGKRMREMDRQLRALAVRYAAYKRLFESAMGVIKSQSALSRDTKGQ